MKQRIQSSLMEGMECLHFFLLPPLSPPIGLVMIAIRILGANKPIINALFSCFVNIRRLLAEERADCHAKDEIGDIGQVRADSDS